MCALNAGGATVRHRSDLALSGPGLVRTGWLRWTARLQDRLKPVRSTSPARTSRWHWSARASAPQPAPLARTRCAAPARAPRCSPRTPRASPPRRTSRSSADRRRWLLLIEDILLRQRFNREDGHVWLLPHISMYEPTPATRRHPRQRVIQAGDPVAGGVVQALFGSPFVDVVRAMTRLAPGSPRRWSALVLFLPSITGAACTETESPLVGGNARAHGVRHAARLHAGRVSPPNWSASWSKPRTERS